MCKTSAFVSNSIFKLVLEWISIKIKIFINPFHTTLQLLVQFGNQIANFTVDFFNFII